MATPGFGFSAGDFIAGVSLVKKLIRALNDTAGSRAAYRKLIAELLNLDEALTDISKLQLRPTQESQKQTLHRVAAQCQKGIEAFLLKNAKINESLGLQPSPSLPSWRVNFHKIQWALCRDTAIDDLRTEIAAHTTTLNLALATIQVSATDLQEQCLDNCTLLLQEVCEETKEANVRAEQNSQALEVHTGMMETISRIVLGLMSGTQEDGLLSLVRKGLQWHVRIFDAVTQMQQLLCSIPPQIEREQPVLFEDAHGRLTPFHVEFINSYNAFQAVLEARFENMPGLRKVRKLEYAMQDSQSKRILDMSRPWESVIRPGRKFLMSMVFQIPKAVISSCPVCSTETSSRLVKEGSDIQCDNPDCGVFYRCITAVDMWKPGKRKRDSHDSPAKRMKQGHKDNGADEDDQDGIHEFRRVQIMSASTHLLDPGDGTSSPRLLSTDLNDPVPTYLPLSDESDVGWTNVSRVSPLQPSRDDLYDLLIDHEPPSAPKAYPDPEISSFSGLIASRGAPLSFPQESDYAQSLGSPSLSDFDFSIEDFDSTGYVGSF